MGLRPLTARSVILSVLLGSHPPRLPVRALVGGADLFGISEGTARVAVSRLASDGDLVAEAGSYRLSPRLLNRQKRQDEGLYPDTRDWDGQWELVVAGPAVAGAADRAALGSELAGLRLAELRPGVWIRPDNLVRTWPARLSGRAWRFESRATFTDPPAAELVASQWDLARWSARSDALMTALASSADPARRFIVAAAMVRHLQDDPNLPPELLPSSWPGPGLRQAYEDYSRELREMMRAEQARHR